MHFPHHSLAHTTAVYASEFPSDFSSSLLSPPNHLATTPKEKSSVVGMCVYGGNMMRSVSGWMGGGESNNHRLSIPPRPNPAAPAAATQTNQYDQPLSIPLPLVE